ncbi:hypothetical protein LTR85_001809 [Meristemomyces frigidus]|nr:hypothetical protein LTR85_001809 [Meristemomyces frigidus]
MSDSASGNPVAMIQKLLGLGVIAMLVLWLIYRLVYRLCAFVKEFLERAARDRTDAPGEPPHLNKNQRKRRNRKATKAEKAALPSTTANPAPSGSPTPTPTIQTSPEELEAGGTAGTVGTAAADEETAMVVEQSAHDQVSMEFTAGEAEKAAKTVRTRCDHHGATTQAGSELETAVTVESSSEQHADDAAGADEGVTNGVGPLAQPAADSCPESHDDSTESDNDSTEGDDSTESEDSIDGDGSIEGDSSWEYPASEESLEMPTVASTNVFRLLDLPRELRDRTDDLVLASDFPSTLSTHPCARKMQAYDRNSCTTSVTPRPALAATNRQLAQETMYVLKRSDYGGVPTHLYLTLDFSQPDTMLGHHTALRDLMDSKAQRIFISFSLHAHKSQRYGVQDLAQQAVTRCEYFQQFLSTLRSATHVTEIVIDWVSCLHREKLGCPVTRVPKPQILNRIVAALETLPKLQRYGVAVHQEAIHASRQAGAQDWRYAVRERHPGRDLMSRGAQFQWVRLLQDMSICAEYFPVYHEQGARICGMWPVLGAGTS